MIKGIFQLNEKSEIQYTNNFLPEILDCTRKDLIDKPILDLVIGADKLLLENVLMRLHRKEIYSYTNRFQIKPPVGDQYYYLQIELSTLEGKIPKAYVKILGIVSVSEATQYAEEHQLRNTLRYEAVFHNSMDGIFVYNYITEKIEMANNAAAKMLDYDNAKDLVGVSHFKFVPQTSDLFSSVDLYETTKMHGQWVVEGKGFPTQGIFVSKNGKEVLVEARIVPTFYKRGEGIIIFQDVTKRVLGKITKRETEQRYKDIFNNTREAIVYIDIKQTKAILCNERTLELCAVDSLEIFQSIPPEKFLAKEYINGKKSRQYFLDLVAETMKKGRVSTALDFRRQTGEEIRIDVVMVSDTSNPKQPKVIIFGRDISRLHQAQVTLTEKNEELQKYIASNLQLENFAYFASHDLQSPLRSIISFTQLLQHRLRDKTGKSEQEYMNFIVSSSKNMKLLIDDLLAFSMVNAGQLNVNNINLQEMLREVMTDMSSSIKDYKAVIHFDHKTMNIRADKIKLKQVFQNLIGNAIKFSRKNEQPIIRILAHEQPSYWQFALKDNGIGIEQEFQDKIFGMFKRLHTTETHTGTGIGLAIVKKVIEQHQGRIWLDSEPNVGTTFWFTIPKNSI